MGKSYGRMIGCRDAIEWVRNLKIPKEEEETREYVLHRMQYEFDKQDPVEPKFHKGIYGRKYDSYSCGNCGFTIETYDIYCPNCGFRITDAYAGRRKTKEEQEGHL